MFIGISDSWNPRCEGPHFRHISGSGNQKADLGPHSTAALERLSWPSVHSRTRESIPPSALESGSRARHFFDVLYICRKSTLAESTSSSGSRATLVAKLLAFNAVSTQIFPMMPHKVIDHLALAIAQDLVISSAITGNPIYGQQPAADGLHEPFSMPSANFLPIQRIALCYKGVTRCQPAIGMSVPVNCSYRAPAPRGQVQDPAHQGALQRVSVADAW